MDKVEKAERIRLHRKFWQVIKENKELFFIGGVALKHYLFKKFCANNNCEIDVVSCCFVCNTYSCYCCLVKFGYSCNYDYSWYALWVQSIEEKNSEDFDKYCDLIKNAPEMEKYNFKGKLC